MSLAKNQANCFNLEHIGWKNYNTTKKKAMEQEFSWSGLLISLSIAFFIVAISALFLNFIFNSMEAGSRQRGLTNKNIYYLERSVQASLSLKQNIKYIKHAKAGIKIKARITKYKICKAAGTIAYSTADKQASKNKGINNPNILNNVTKL